MVWFWVLGSVPFPHPAVWCLALSWPLRVRVALGREKSFLAWGGETVDSWPGSCISLPPSLPPSLSRSLSPSLSFSVSVSLPFFRSLSPVRNTCTSESMEVRRSPRDCPKNKLNRMLQLQSLAGGHMFGRLGTQDRGSQRRRTFHTTRNRRRRKPKLLDHLPACSLERHGVVATRI